jgi:hypothetical protein
MISGDILHDVDNPWDRGTVETLLHENKGGCEILKPLKDC